MVGVLDENRRKTNCDYGECFVGMCILYSANATEYQSKPTARSHILFNQNKWMSVREYRGYWEKAPQVGFN